MKRLMIVVCFVFVVEIYSCNLCYSAEPAPIEKVTIGENREFLVNDKPFFPIMVWLQDAKNFPAVRATGMNTVAGYYPGSSSTADVVEYADLVRRAGFYGVMPFDVRLKGRDDLLAYIHDDEPDLPHTVSDAEVVPSPDLRINRRTPLWKIVDGVTHSWSVLDPMQGAEITIRLKKPVTVTSLAVWPTASKGLAIPKDVVFQGDNKTILEATLKAERGRQLFTLEKPATFKDLKMIVKSVHPGDNIWGSIGEIEGLDAAGNNVLLSPPRNEPRAWPDETLAKYKAAKAADPTRPLFMTLTGNFCPHFNKWSDDERTKLYTAYVKAADVVGYDIYPIYGWNKPQWIYLVHDATEQLVEMAGRRPVYVWIETSRGGQYTGDLERQTKVTPTHIRAEVWMSICRGATAIGYFTHIWKPSYNQFGVPEENRRALREINDQITRLTPAILGDKPKTQPTLSAEGTEKVDLMAKQHDGALYLFAVNYDEKLVETNVTFNVPGLAAGTKIEVVDENRTISATAGSFTDKFDPLAVHIYKFRL